MIIYLVASAQTTWMRTGYGHSLLATDAERILVSFAEHLKPGAPGSLKVEGLQDSYVPEIKEAPDSSIPSTLLLD